MAIFLHPAILAAALAQFTAISKQMKIPPVQAVAVVPPAVAVLVIQALDTSHHQIT